MILSKTYVDECYRKVKINVMAFTHRNQDVLNKQTNKTGFCKISFSDEVRSIGHYGKTW